MIALRSLARLCNLRTLARSAVAARLPHVTGIARTNQLSLSLYNAPKFTFCWQGHNHTEFAINGGRLKLKVVIGDITEQATDAIFNSASPDMQHQNGIAAHIVKVGGDKIREEGLRTVGDQQQQQQQEDKQPQQQQQSLRAGGTRNREYFKPGQVVVTSGGDLPCKHVIHAIMPVWRDGRRNEEEVLKQAVFNALRAASRNNAKSVAIPALATDSFGFPKTHSAQLIFDAVFEFAQKNPDTPIEEIRFVNREFETSGYFQRELRYRKSYNGYVGLDKETQADTPEK